MKRNVFKKSISILLLTAVLSASFGSLALPRPTHAVVPVDDLRNNLKEYGLDTFLRTALLKPIINALIASVISWIRTGDSFRGDGPLFVTDFDKFMLDAADQASGIFLKEYVSPETYNFLCTPFRADIYRLVALGLPRYPSANSFGYKARCTVSDIVANVEDFYQDFENGGWEAWVETALYANNPYGLLSLARMEKEERELRNVGENRNDFQTGAGFIASTICLEYREFQGPPSPDGTPPGRECVRTLKETIGSAVKTELEGLVQSDFSGLYSADEISEIIMAALQALFTRAMQGSGGLLGGSYVPDPLTPPPSLAQCGDGIDNDGDGSTDYPFDQDCTDSIDTSEDINGNGEIVPPPPDDPPPPPPV